jgi:hypothetical protein
MTKRYCLLAILTFMLLGGGEARAWSDLGHEVICEIAFRLVQPNTQAAINRLIALDHEFKTFSRSCTYPDNPRTRADEHFVNLPRDSKGLTSDECPLAKVCVLTAILHDFYFLRAGNDDASKLEALKSLGHWVGDIHQPLHVAFLDDKGGNNIKTSGCSRKLHEVWDNCLVKESVGSDVSTAADKLKAAITPQIQSMWNASISPRDWANESFAITESTQTMYCTMHGSSCDMTASELTITASYLDANKPVVKQQLERAAVRLARLLDEAFH